MPVIVIGADGPGGHAVARSLARDGADVRAFVSHPSETGALRASGIKVATGDLSDRSHVAGAAMGAFCAVVMGDAVLDGRELAFAASPDAAFDEIAAALREAGIQRLIWTGSGPMPRALEGAVADSAAVIRDPDDDQATASAVLALESAPRVRGR